MYAKLRLLGHIQEKQKHNLFFEGQDGDGPVTRRATRCSVYRDINLSPVPAWCDGVFGLWFLELGYELRNGFCVNSHIFMRQWRGLRGLSVYEFTQRYGYNYDDEKTR